MNTPNHRIPELRRRLAIVACYATMFMLGMTISLLGPSLPALADHTGIALSQAGVFFTLFAAGSVIATILVARLNDRPVRHLVLIAGALLMGLGQWLLASSSTFTQAALAVALTGLAMSTVGTGPNAIMADLYRGRTGQALNTLHISAGVGAFIGPLLLGAALHAGSDYRVVYKLAAVLMLTVGMLWVFSRPPRPQRDVSQSRTSLAWMAPLLLVFALTLLYTGTETAVGGWLFTYARTAIEQEATFASLATSFLWLAILFGRLAAVQVLRRVSPLGLLQICVLGGAVGLALILFGQTWGPSFWGGVALTGFCFGPVFPTALALSNELAPGEAGAASSLVVASGSVGAMVLPWTAGALIPHVGVSGSMGAVFVPLACMLACLCAITRQHAVAA